MSAQPQQAPEQQAPEQAGAVGASPAVPPVARKQPTQRIHHGDVVVDEYEWLRDAKDPQVTAHLEAENAWTTAQTAHLQPLREQIYDEIVERTQETDLSVPTRRGSWWYLMRTVEGGQYGVYCRLPVTAPDDWDPPAVEAGVPGTGEEVLLDGNAEAEGHAFFALGALAVSTDGRRLAYAVDVVGDERYTVRVKDLDTGTVLPDEVPGTGGSVNWSSDASVLFYTVVDDAWRPYQVRRHVLGTPAVDDQVVFTEPDERFWVGIETTTSRRFLVLDSSSKLSSEVRLLDLATPSAQPTVVAPRRPGVEYSVDHLVLPGDEPGIERVLLLHNDGAPNFMVSVAELGDPDPSHWVTVVPPDETTRVLDVLATQRSVIVSVRRDGLRRVVVMPLTDGRSGLDAIGAGWEVPFDEPLFTCGVGASPEPESPLLRLSYGSFVTPQTVYDLDVRTRELVLRKQTAVLGGVDLSRYEQHREWATAADGARIPVSVVCRAGTPRDGTAPTLLYGYGSYEMSIDPSLAVPRLSLLDRGVVFAVAHVRGGGELGRRWYEQGRLLEKCNTFTDFLSAADHLVESGWSDGERLVAMGGSAGGLLVGAALNLAPSRFAGVVAAVPFVDALTTILDHEHHGRQAADQPEQHVQRRRMGLDADAGEPDGLNVAADGYGAPPERGAVQQHPPARRDEGEDDHEHRNAEHVAAEEVDERAVLHDLGAAVGDDLGEPPSRGEHRQRRDEGGQAAVGDDDAVDEAAGPPDEQGDADHDDPVDVCRHRLRGQGRGPHRRQRHDRADRQVDAPSGDDERHADGHHPDDRGLAQDRQGVACVGEALASRDHPDDAEDHERDHEADAAERRAAQRPAQRARLDVEGVRRARPPRRRLVRGVGPFGRGLGQCRAHAASPLMTMSRTACSSMSAAGPLWRIRPSATTRTRSESPRTSSISLETTTTATPESVRLRTRA